MGLFQQRLAERRRQQHGAADTLTVPTIGQHVELQGVELSTRTSTPQEQAANLRQTRVDQRPTGRVMHGRKPHPVSSPVGKIIDRICEREKVSIIAMATASGIDRTMLQRVRNGERLPSYETAVKIAERWPMSHTETVQFFEHLRMIPPGYRLQRSTVAAHRAVKAAKKAAKESA